MVKASETTALEDELKGLVAKIKEAQKAVADKELLEACADLKDAPKVLLKAKRIFKGHLGKVNCVHFGADSRLVVSGALDSKLIIWDTWTGNKVQIIPLQSSWTMTCCLSPSGRLVASGGMDNQCTIFDLEDKEGGSAKIKRELLGYEGFLSCCRFIDDNKLITGSADMKIILWDLEKTAKISEFYGHSGDVMSMSLHSDGNLFLTGSVDKTAKLWDVREGVCKQTFWGHEGDVNSVHLHANGFVFGTASEDKSSRLFDIRADQQLTRFQCATPCSFTSCAISTSGRIVMCGADDGSIHFWDSLKATANTTLAGHENKITSLTLADNGMAVVTGSWDSSVRLWV